MRGDRYDPKGRKRTFGGVYPPFDKAKCAAELFTHYDIHQCDRKPQPDTEGGEWCRTHDPARRRAKAAKAAAERKANAKRGYKRDVTEAQAPYVRAAAAALEALEEWRESGDKYDPAVTIRAAIMALAEEAGEKVYVPWELRQEEEV